MTYAVFDGTYLERHATGMTRVTHELLQAMAPLVGPGRPVERLAIATFSGSVKPQYAVAGLEVLKMGLGPRLSLLATMVPGVFNLTNRLGPRPDAVCWQIPERFSKDVRGVRQVVIVHDLSMLRYPEMRPAKVIWLCNMALKRVRNSSCGIIAISEATRQELAALADIPLERVSVVHWAAGRGFHVIEDKPRLDEVAARLGLTGKRFILFTGYPSPRKRVPTLMRIFREVRRRRAEPICLVLAGPGHQDVDRLCSELDYSAEDRRAVIVPGFLEDEDLAAVYNLAWLLVFPTLYEGFGLPVIEAMACGTPVISSNVSCIPEVAGGAALLLDPGEPEQWIDAICALTEDEQTWTDLRDRGLAHARTMTWERAAGQFLEILAQP